MALVLDGGKWVLQAPSSGGSEYDKTLTIIDLTDGSWTLYDPDSLIDTTYGTNGVTFASDFNTIQFNNLAVGSSNYNWVGSVHRAPRWYKTLTINGNDVAGEDTLTGVFRIEDDDTVSDFNRRLILGWSEDPTAVAASGTIITAASYNRSEGSAPLHGAFSYQSDSSISDANGAYVVANLMRKKYADLGGGYYIIYNSSDSVLRVGTAGGTLGFNNAGVTMKLIVGVGPRLNTSIIPAGSLFKAKLSYLVSTIVTT